MKIAFALGGGGARGIAHVGVIKALEEAGIKPNIIVGTSMGAIIGAMYAQIGNPGLVEDKIIQFIHSKDYAEMGLKTYRRNHEKDSFLGNFIHRLEERIVINLSYSQEALFKQEKFYLALNYLLEDGLIEELPVKFAAVTGDLLTGDKVVLTSGDIKMAVLASSSIPGFLPPVDYAKWKLADGEIVDLVPCETAKELNGRFVIGVDVGQGLLPCPPMDNALDIIFRATQIKSKALAIRIMQAADIIIQPDVSQYHWTHFEKADELIQAGYQAGKACAVDVKKKLKTKKWRFWKK